MTLSSATLSGPGVRMTTHVEDVSTRVGLLIDGDVVAGGEGTYPVTNPARPAEVVLDAPSTTPAQLDQAVAAARRSQRAWAALAPDDRAALGRRRGRSRRCSRRERTTWPACSPGSTARPTSRRSSTPPPWAAWRRPSRPWWPRRSRRVTSAVGPPGSSGCPTASSPPSCPSTGRCRSWATRCCPRSWPATPWWSRPHPPARARCCSSPRPWPQVLPPGVLNVVNGPAAALGAALVGHPGVDMVSFTGGVRTGQAVMAAAAAHDPARRARARRQRRRHPRSRRGR